MANALLSQAFGSGGIKSVQRGLATFGPSDIQIDVTISAVNPVKAIEHWNGFYGNGSLVSDSYASVRLLNSTTLRLNRYSTGPALTIAWVVQEWN